MRLLLLNFFFSCSSFFLVNKCIASDSLSVKYLSIDQGLSNNAVTCVYQDRKGFMWFGSYDGLNKFDGYSIQVFRNVIDDPTSLLDNHIYCINADSKNNIWAGSIKGISIYSASRSIFATPLFQKIGNTKAEPLKDGTRTIKRIGEVMLAGTASNGLIVFPGNGTPGKQIALPGDNPGHYSVTAIEYDSIRKETWVFVAGRGLYKYDLNKNKLNFITKSITAADCIFIRSDGSVMAGNNTGVYHLEKNIFRTFTPAPKMTVRDIVEDSRHGLWIATDGNGLWQLPMGAVKAKPFSDKAERLNSNSIYDLYIDAEGRQWIATLRGGINIIEQKAERFTTISNNKKDQQVNDFVLSFCEDEKSNLWIGTDGWGLRYWNKQNNKFTQYVHTAKPGSLSSNFVTNITKDSHNDIWISTWFGGINKLNKSDHTFKHYVCYNPIAKGENNNVWFLYEDSRKRLWASTTNDGNLYVYNRAIDRFVLFDNRLVNLQVMAEDSQGNLWSGNYTTLIKIDTTKKEHKVFNIGYPVRSIYEDKSHNFWVGTEGGGLLLFNKLTGNYSRFTTKDGLPNNAILRILEDNKRNLWLSTYFGLCRFSPSTRISRNFTQADGLQSNQFSFNAAMITKSGAFLFGGIKGFNIFYPDSIYEQKKMPRLFLTGLKIDNIPATVDTDYVTAQVNGLVSDIVIPFSKATFSAEFTALEYSNANKLKYAYYLQGWDARWTVVDNSRTANYTHLEEGNYTFFVKVMNADGIWSAKQKLLSIRVLPPWYRAWWAYLFYILLAVVAGYTIILYYKKRERWKYEVELALFEREKEKELTGKKAAFFTHIAHEFRAPLTLIINPIQDLLVDMTSAPEKQKLITIQRNARRLLSLVDQLLLFGKADAGVDETNVSKCNFFDLCQEVFICFTYQAKSKNIFYQLIGDESGMELYVDREKIEIILFNLISNALKYTAMGGSVICALVQDEETIKLTISDTGPGIDESVGNKLFERFYRQKDNKNASKSGFGIGLFLVKQFTEAHGGTITYTSEKNKGTEFVVVLKKGTAHFGPGVIIDENPVQQVIIGELISNIAADEKNTLNMVPQPELQEIFSEKKSILIVDDDTEMREYLFQIFKDGFILYQANNGEEAFELAQHHLPDIVISDVTMSEMTGLELCRKIKETPALKHIPVLLLTASSSSETKLKVFEGGADDYITKPFEKNILVARVVNILKSHNNLQQYFFSGIILQNKQTKISSEHKEFLERCIAIVEKNMNNDELTISMMIKEMNLSHSSLYKKVKSISGESINSFIRLIRLRRAALLLLSTDMNVSEACFEVGMRDIRYFRKQFVRLFGMPPTEYIKKYKSTFDNKFNFNGHIK